MFWEAMLSVVVRRSGYHIPTKQSVRDDGAQAEASQSAIALGSYWSHVSPMSHAASGPCDSCRAVCEMLAFPEFCSYLARKS